MKPKLFTEEESTNSVVNAIRRMLLSDIDNWKNELIEKYKNNPELIDELLKQKIIENYSDIANITIT
jgi:DNA-directed RNA polymerase alpha subunit